MNILALNGSPRSEKSNTLRLTRAFLEGINRVGSHTVETITIADKKIEPCRGCYCCWEKTPGVCVVADDMRAVFEKYLRADMIIWSFPLYYFGMPSKTKALLDRLLPLNLPDIVIHADETASHLPRYDLKNQKHILISTCGFFTAQNNYDALIKQFEILYGEGFSRILCPEGELFGIPELETRTGEYLAYVTEAGKEYAAYGEFSGETQNRLNDPLYPPLPFMELANLNWEKGQSTVEVLDDAHRILRQMAVLYTPHGKDRDTVLEFYFTDLDKTYQLVLGRTKCLVKIDEFSP
jgi:multimeric flavodoxin WrbA